MRVRTEPQGADDLHGRQVGPGRVPVRESFRQPAHELALPRTKVDFAPLARPWSLQEVPAGVAVAGGGKNGRQFENVTIPVRHDRRTPNLPPDCDGRGDHSESGVAFPAHEHRCRLIAPADSARGNRQIRDVEAVATIEIDVAVEDSELTGVVKNAFDDTDHPGFIAKLRAAFDRAIDGGSGRRLAWPQVPWRREERQQDR